MREASTLDAAAERERRRATLADVHLEFVSHPDNGLFIGLALAVAAGLVATGGQAADLLWIAFGVAVFIPQEYYTHVHLLHRAMPASRRAYLWFYRLHYGHHDHPRRHDLMYMPLWLTLPMMAANLGLLWLLTPNLRAFWAAFGGAVLGYLVFEWTHLLCHVPYVPASRLWRHVRSLHLLHHFADEKKGYAVAPWALFMDGLMGTRVQREAGARSSSSRFLGLDAGHPWLDEARRLNAHRSNGDAVASRLWLRAAAVKRDAP